MRIAIVGTAYPYRGGIASFIHRMGEEFAQNGHEVEIITFTSQYPDWLFPGSSQYNEGPNPTLLPIRRKIHSANPLNWIKVGRWLKSQAYDMIICKYWMPYFGASFGTFLRIARSSGTKTYCIVDNLIPHERRFFDKAFSKYFTNSIDGFVVMSESVKRDVQSMVRNKPISLVRHPIYDNYGELVDQTSARAHLQLDQDAQYVLFFGFIREYKGLDLLIEAMDDPWFDNENIHLIIAGEYYGDNSIYEKLLTASRLKHKIHHHTHFIPDDEVRYYFGACDLVVQPYRSATQSGISQLAIYFEKPMVVTDVGGLQEIVGDEKGGYVVSVAVDQINEAIKRYFSSTDKDAMISYIRQLKKQFAWSTLYDEIIVMDEAIRTDV